MFTIVCADMSLLELRVDLALPSMLVVRFRRLPWRHTSKDILFIKYVLYKFLCALLSMRTTSLR